MPRMRLLKPCKIVVEAISRPETPQDQNSREPIGDSSRIRYELPAQRTNVHREMPMFEQAGPDEQIRGWFTILISDAKALGYRPARGDRIMTVGDDWSTELYVVNYEPCGHWRHGAQGLRLYFGDRRPGAAQPDRSDSAWSR